MLRRLIREQIVDESEVAEIQHGVSAELDRLSSLKSA
jgi:hypothetical protein